MVVAALLMMVTLRVMSGGRRLGRFSVQRYLGGFHVAFGSSIVQQGKRTRRETITPLRPLFSRRAPPTGVGQRRWEAVCVHRLSALGSTMPGTEDALLENRRAFVAFARQRLGDPDLAEDVVQDSLLKALSAAHQPDAGQNTVAWFYRILRRSIIDLYRRADARSRAMERFAQEFPESPGTEDERLLCQCFKRLLPSVPAQYRELLTAVDLQGEDPGEVARRLGVSRNNLTVRLHRARKHLREALTENCQACGNEGYLECTCDEPRATGKKTGLGT
jgi:RNA polymerase sigma-70 factor (ECF subfamily)